MLSLITWLTAIQRLCMALAAIALGALPLITFYDVLMRYLFLAPTIWASEISLYLLQFIVFLTLGALMLDDSHVRVTFWIEALSGTRRLVGELVDAALVLPFAWVLLVQGYSYTANAYNREMLSPTLLQIPLWLPYALIPAGGVLLALGVVTKMLILLQHYTRGRVAETGGGERT